MAEEKNQWVFTSAAEAEAAAKGATVSVSSGPKGTQYIVPALAPAGFAQASPTVQAEVLAYGYSPTAESTMLHSPEKWQTVASSREAALEAAGLVEPTIESAPSQPGYAPIVLTTPVQEYERALWSPVTKVEDIWAEIRKIVAKSKAPGSPAIWDDILNAFVNPIKEGQKAFIEAMKGLAGTTPEEAMTKGLTFAASAAASAIAIHLVAYFMDLAHPTKDTAAHEIAAKADFVMGWSQSAAAMFQRPMTVGFSPWLDRYFRQLFRPAVYDTQTALRLWQKDIIKQDRATFCLEWDGWPKEAVGELFADYPREPTHRELQVMLEQYEPDPAWLITKLQRAEYGSEDRVIMARALFARSMSTETARLRDSAVTDFIEGDITLEQLRTNLSSLPIKPMKVELWLAYAQVRQARDKRREQRKQAEAEARELQRELDSEARAAAAEAKKALNTFRDLMRVEAEEDFYGDLVREETFILNLGALKYPGDLAAVYIARARLRKRRKDQLQERERIADTAKAAKAAEEEARKAAEQEVKAAAKDLESRRKAFIDTTVRLLQDEATQDYVDGWVDEATMTSNLAAILPDPNLVPVYVAEAKLRRLRTRRREAEEIITLNFKKDVINADEYMTQLLALPMQPDVAAATVNLETLRKLPTPKVKK